MSQLSLIVDDRERKSLEAAFFAANVTVTWKRLHEAADILICAGEFPVMAFERKAKTDLTGSIKGNKHLFHQRDQMLDFSRRTNCRVSLLIEDSHVRGWDGVSDNVSNKFVEAVVASTTLLKGLYLSRTKDKQSTVALVEYIRTKIEKEMNELNIDFTNEEDVKTFWSRRAEGVDEFKPVVAKTGGRRGNFTGRNAALAMLQQVPGLSLNRAETLLESFGSLANVMKYYRENEDAGKGNKRIKDEIADLQVKKRRLGESVSASLRAVLYNEETNV